MKSTIALLVLLAALDTAPITAATSDEKPDARNAAPDCLADLPPLKGISMRISEQAFLDLLKFQGLAYTRQTRDGETTYVVEVRKDAIIFFGFREGRCMSVQRYNGVGMG